MPLVLCVGLDSDDNCIREQRERACPWKKSLIYSLALVKNGKHMVRYLERQSCLPTDVYSEDEEDAV